MIRPLTERKNTLNVFSFVGLKSPGQLRTMASGLGLGECCTQTDPIDLSPDPNYFRGIIRRLNFHMSVHPSRPSSSKQLKSVKSQQS